eukprot:10560991-Karenia_brevis.AAC.1
MDTYTCLLCQGVEGDDIPPLVQMETHAFLAWDKFNKGKSGKGKSKEAGKGKGKGERFYSWSHGMKPKLGLKERQNAPKKLKSETKCSDCGEVGHW